MVQLLNQQVKKTAEQMLVVQLLAYKIEADLIEFQGIPQLQETIQDIMESEEIFVGCYDQLKLVGFLSYIETDEKIDICKLVVHPSYFRKGIASSLLKHLLSVKSPLQQMIVTTGAKNTPAIELYKRFGFIKIKDIEVEPNFFITQLIQS